MSEPNHPLEFKPQKVRSGRSWLVWLAAAGGLAYWSRRRSRRRGHEDDSVDPQDIERGHRPSSDTSETGVALFAAALLLLLALILAIVWLLMKILGGAGAPVAEGPYGPTESDPLRPDLRSDPSVELMYVRNREDSLLNRYEWVDREAGVVRIPIERAMEYVAVGAEGDTVRDTLRMPTESGFVDVAMGVPPPASPPFLGMSPEPTVVNAEIAEILGLIRTSGRDSLVPEGGPAR